MTAERRTGILGGTFDPIHAGHVAAAGAAADILGLDEVLFIPSHLPPHRTARPRASMFDRFAMVALAVDADPRFVASDLELGLDGPSYTAVTLRALQAGGRTASQLFFITGTDAFAEIATWHDYPAILGLAHFVVISRPGQSFDRLRVRLPDLASTMCEVEDRPPTARQVASPCIFLVHADTPDVSSTAIRSIAAAGQSLAGVVAAPVERYIARHRLYASE